MTENICISGGAAGADYAWALAARDNGHQVIHWSFAGHKTTDKNDIHILSDDLLLAADIPLAIANIGVKRKWPTTSQHINNLLRRNYYQIIHTDAVYAVSRIVGDRSELAIAGGTAWACQLYIDKCRRETVDPNLYIFDQVTEQWYVWHCGLWDRLDAVPSPRGIYTGIGSRDITDAALHAIINVYKV